MALYVPVGYRNNLRKQIFTPANLFNKNSSINFWKHQATEIEDSLDKTNWNMNSND